MGCFIEALDKLFGWKHGITEWRLSPMMGFMERIESFRLGLMMNGIWLLRSNHMNFHQLEPCLTMVTMHYRLIRMMDPDTLRM